MDLKELEFKPGDLETRAMEDEANRILHKKLAKAPEVFLNRRVTAPKVHAKYWTEYENDLTLDGPVTHRARLVCIEEIEK